MSIKNERSVGISGLVVLVAAAVAFGQSRPSPLRRADGACTLKSGDCARTDERTCAKLGGTFSRASADCSPAIPQAGNGVGIAGTVYDAATLEPLAGALVSLQATAVRTITAEDGSYFLQTGDGQSLAVVGAAKSYFYDAVIAAAPADGVDLFLDAVPADQAPNYAYTEPSTCANCHPDQYGEWLGSPMADAGFNHWVDDIYSGDGTPGGLGGFVYLRDSVFAEDHPNSECAACHQPHLWLETPGVALADPHATPPPAVVHGVSCDLCHKVADVNVANINYPGVIDGAVDIARPLGDQVQFGVLGDVTYHAPGQMRASYQPQLVAEACGLCHQDKNDLHGDGGFDGVISEPTYLEWLESPYSDPTSEHHATCVDCHMPAAGHTQACVVLFPPLERAPDTIRSHDIRGTTPEYLENAVELWVDAAQQGPYLAVNAEVRNTLTGHHVPTGVTVRNMILLVEALDDSTGEPLGFLAGPTVHALGGVGDAAQGYYAGLPGKFYAKVNHDANGNGPTFFTDATGIQFDNRIPALQHDATTYTFAVPSGGGPVVVRARLIYRRAFRFLVDAKQWTIDGQGHPLADVAPPHYGHLMEESVLSLNTVAVPLIIGSIPPDGAIDARQPSAIDGSQTSGWAGIALTFDGDASTMLAEDFELVASGAEPPGIAEVVIDGPHVTLLFDGPIQPGSCNAVRHAGGATVQLKYLPGDVNGDGTTGTLDLLHLIDGLNGVVALHPWQCDTNRSGQCEPSDILRVIDLLSGADAYDVWNGATLPACP